MCIRDRSNNVWCKHKFYTRLQNLTSIDLNTDETDLLNKGLKYNLPLHKSNLNCEHIIGEVINVETVVKAMVVQKDQDETRFLINDKFNKIIKNQSNNIYSSAPLTNINYNKERKILSDLRHKLSDNHALVTSSIKVTPWLLWTWKSMTIRYRISF